MRLTESKRASSLRSRLAILGVVGVALPVLILMVLFIATSSEEIDSSGIAPEDPAAADFVVEDSSGGVSSVVVIGAAVLTILGSALAWAWSGRAVRPLAEIASVANEIQHGSLDHRIGLTGAAYEVQSLADSFDAMLDRLARSSGTQRQLIEDASHELRTPLAALAINNEVILTSRTPSAADYRESAERSAVLIGRLQLTIDELLMDARSQASSAAQVNNDLMEVVARVVDQHRSVNPQIPIVVEGPVQLYLGIDGASVQRALVNLVDNAARYSPAGVPIEISVIEGDQPQLSVTDHGPGIPAHQQGSVFDRYVQGDDRGGDGAGIGLAVVKQVAEAHGRIDVTSPLDSGPGTRFTLTFGV